MRIIPISQVQENPNFKGIRFHKNVPEEVINLCATSENLKEIGRQFDVYFKIEKFRGVIGTYEALSIYIKKKSNILRNFVNKLFPKRTPYKERISTSSFHRTCGRTYLDDLETLSAEQIKNNINTTDLFINSQK